MNLHPDIKHTVKLKREPYGYSYRNGGWKVVRKSFSLPVKSTVFIILRVLRTLEEVTETECTREDTLEAVREYLFDYRG